MAITRKTYLAALAVMLAPMAAMAAPIVGGSGLASPGNDLDFSEIPLADFSLLTNQYDSLGVDFSGVWYNGCTECVVAQPNGAHPEIANFTNNNTAAFTSTTSMAFSGLVSDASFAFASNGGTFTLSALLNGSLVESFNFEGSNWQTYGFSNSLFNEIRISTPSAMIFDNLRFNTVSVPEPGTLALLGLGLLGIGLTRLRRVRA